MKTKLLSLSVVIVVLSVSATPIKIPSKIAAYYSDWNFIATMVTKEQQDRYWGMLDSRKLPDETRLGKNDLLILRSISNVYKAYPEKTKNSPIGSRILYLTGEIQEKKDTLHLKYEMKVIKGKIDSAGFLDLKQVMEVIDSFPVSGRSECVWQYENDDYRLLEEGIKILTNRGSQI